MQYLAVLIIVAIILGGVILVHRWRRQGEALPEYHIHLFIPFATPPCVDAKSVMQQFKSRWGAQVACGEAEGLAGPQKDSKTYFIGNGTHNLRFAVSRVPLPPDLVDITVVGAGLDDADRTALRNHQGYISIDYLLGPPDDAVARVGFSAKTLLTLAALNGTLGYGNVSAMSYRPRSHFEPYLRRSPLQSTDLYMLFANMHFVADQGSTHVHTHGLEQFGVPDLQTRFTDPAHHAYYRSLISNAAVYMIESGPVFKPGDTAEVKGDGVIYRFQAARRERDHPFGSFGCLKIARE